MCIYHVLINALSAHMIHVNLNMMLYTHVEHSPIKTIYIKYYTETHTHPHAHMHACTHARTRTHARTHTHTHKHTHTRKVFSLALKDERVEQCLRSCGSEFQMWGPKQEKVRKPGVLRLDFWIFSMRVSEEERSVLDGV